MSGPLYALALLSLSVLAVGAGDFLAREASFACLAVGAAGFGLVLGLAHRKG